MDDLNAMRADAAAAIAAAKVPTEAEMRDAEAPWPKSMDELTACIKGLVERPHDYGTCVYAMSLAATAAFHYVASEVGATGFQASCADMDVIRRTRRLKGPFMILDIKDALYPQYDIVGRVQEYIRDQGQWLGDQARKNLADAQHAHPDVIAHWRKLAEQWPATAAP